MMFKKSSRIKSHLFAGFMMWCLISGFCLPLAWPQIGIPFKAAPAKPLAEPVPAKQTLNENPGDHEQTIGRLERALAEARQDYQNTRPVLENTMPEQIGATEHEVNQKLRLLSQKISLYEQHIVAYRTLEEIRHADSYLSVADKGPSRYGDGPPYAVHIVDQFRDDISDLNFKIDEKTALRAFLLKNQAESRDELKKSERKLRLATEALERQRSSENRLRLKWLRDFSLLENEVSRIRSLALKTQVESIGAIIAFDRKELAVFEQHFAEVTSDVVFTKEDLDRNLSDIEKEKQTIVAQHLEAIAQDRSNQEKLRLHRQALMPGKAEKSADDSASRRQLEVLQAWADTSSQITDMYFFMIVGLDVEKILWEERYRLAVKRDDIELKKAAEFLEKSLVKLNEFQLYISSSLERSQNLAFNQQRKADDSVINEEERAFALEILEAYQQRSVFLSLNIPKINNVIRKTERFLSEVRGRREQFTVTERIASIFDHGRDFLVSTWHYELFAVDDTIFIDGEKVTGQRAVTVSKIMLALLILIIGFWLSAPLKKKVGAMSARFFHVNEAEVVLIEKTFHLFIFISLVIFALVTVKIPLTVFAFMGGALAIGVGFGAQNLINNFISGVILLLEQPIKVGDIIEIDGMSGTVVGVGARCSQVRRFDGIDILVPNSEFLQKNVVNWTLSDSDLRLSIKFGIAYGSTTRDVSQIVKRILEEHGRILKSPPPVILLDDFGDSALIFIVHFWVHIDPERTYRIIESDFRHMLSKRLSEAGLVIAFPQQDVHLDAGKPISVSLVPAAAAPDHKLSEAEDDTEEQPVT